MRLCHNAYHVSVCRLTALNRFPIKGIGCPISMFYLSLYRYTGAWAPVCSSLCHVVKYIHVRHTCWTTTRSRQRNLGNVLIAHDKQPFTVMLSPCKQYILYLIASFKGVAASVTSLNSDCLLNSWLVTSRHRQDDTFLRNRSSNALDVSPWLCFRRRLKSSRGL